MTDKSSESIAIRLKLEMLAHKHTDSCWHSLVCSSSRRVETVVWSTDSDFKKERTGLEESTGHCRVERDLWPHLLDKPKMGLTWKLKSVGGNKDVNSVKWNGKTGDLFSGSPYEGLEEAPDCCTWCEARKASVSFRHRTPTRWRRRRGAWWWTSSGGRRWPCLVSPRRTPWLPADLQRTQQWASPERKSTPTIKI